MYSVKNALLGSSLTHTIKSDVKVMKDEGEVKLTEESIRISCQIKEAKKAEIQRLTKAFIKRTMQGKPGNPKIVDILSAIVGILLLKY